MEKFDTYNFKFDEIMNHCGELLAYSWQLDYLRYVLKEFDNCPLDDLKNIFRDDFEFGMDEDIFSNPILDEIHKIECEIENEDDLKLSNQKLKDFYSASNSQNSSIDLIEIFSLFHFDFDWIMIFCHRLKTVREKILYLEWILKESEKFELANTPPNGVIVRKDNFPELILNELVFFQKQLKFVEELPSSQKKHLKIETFIPSGDYRLVNFKGKKYALTSKQAEVIQHFHEAHLNGSPEVGSDFILEKVGSESSRLRDIFKSSPDVWKDLIAQGQRKGLFKLNI